MNTRAGFIGLGNIGRPMAERLIAAGLPTTVCDLRPAVMKTLVALGANAAAQPSDVAHNCDVVGICVRDDDDVKAVALGKNGLLAGAQPNMVIAIHSTVLPATIEEVARAASGRGVGVVDACVTGGPAGAAAGTLIYMVGGREEDLERCHPCFVTAAKQIIHTGPLGTGAATKLCNNLMTYLGFVAAFEATTLARGAGIAQDKLEEVTRSNGNMTEQMLAFLTLHKLDTRVRSDPEFQELIKNYAALAEKDLEVTLRFARERGVFLPGTALCREMMARVYGVNDTDRVEEGD